MEIGGVKDAAEPAEARAWIAVLAGTVLLQAVASFLSRAAPTIAPTLTQEIGLAPSTIGYLSAVGTFGSIAFLLAGSPLIRRLGSIRTLQIGTALGAAGAILFLVPQALAAVLAVFFIGLGYGPSPAAGSDILQRYAPAGRRSLVFSIKQAGVPLGGVLAGVLLPPVVTSYGLTGVVVCCVVIGLAAVLAVEPLRSSVDAGRDHRQRVDLESLFGISNLAAPFRAVAASRAQTHLALAGACFAICQGCWFAFLVTFLVVELGYCLAGAGALFAVMQATGVLGRIVLGWAADRIGSARRVLTMAGMASAACSVALALAGAGWPVEALVVLTAVAGVAVSSWNGVQLAEVARLSSRENIHFTTSGATAVIFLGYILGPTAFAALIAGTGSYDIGYVAVAAAGLAGAWLAALPERGEPSA